MLRFYFFFLSSLQDFRIDKQLAEKKYKKTYHYEAKLCILCIVSGKKYPNTDIISTFISRKNIAYFKNILRTTDLSQVFDPDLNH